MYLPTLCYRNTLEPRSSVPSRGISIWYVSFCNQIVVSKKKQVFSCVACSFDPQYGFIKVRRGPETDMYAHPSFLRHDPEGLLNLRKVPTATRTVVVTNNKGSVVVHKEPARAISPSSATTYVEQPSLLPPIFIIGTTITTPTLVPVSPPPPRQKAPESPKGPDLGRLDLLAFALEQEAFAA